MSLHFSSFIFNHLISVLKVRRQSAEIYMCLNGLGNREPTTLQATANLFDVSRERVRQIKKSIEDKMVKSQPSCSSHPFYTYIGYEPGFDFEPLAVSDLLRTGLFGLGIQPQTFVHLYRLMTGFEDILYSSEPVCGFAQPIIGTKEQCDMANRLSQHVKDKMTKQPGARVYSVIDFPFTTETQTLELKRIADKLYPGRRLDKSFPVLVEQSAENQSHHIVIGRKDNRLFGVLKKIANVTNTASLLSITNAFHSAVMNTTRGESVNLPTHFVVAKLLEDFNFVSITQNVYLDSDPSRLMVTLYHDGDNHLSVTEQAFLSAVKSSEIERESIEVSMKQQGINARLVKKCIDSSPLSFIVKEIRSDLDIVSDNQ